jgi:glycerophosphoryl diester phosphodiesterase
MRCPRRTALFIAVMTIRVAAFDIVAHRGASRDAPENTLASTRLGWSQGADAVETDIRLTRDARVIVCHDQTTQRTTGHDGLIPAMTLAELRALDAGRWKGPQYAGEKLPLLEEQLALIPAGKTMLVEIKTGPEIVPEFRRVLAAAGATERNVTVISFNLETLKAVRRDLPAFRTLRLLGYQAADAKDPTAERPPTIDDVIRDAKASGLTGLDLQHTWPLTPADVNRVRGAGLELHVWTVDDPAVARRWIALGVASITTNRPGWLREQLRP